MTNVVNHSGFTNLNLGSNPPIAIPMEEVEVNLSGAGLMEAYASAFVREAFRMNPERAKAVDLKEDELIAYANYLLTKRIEVINNDCKDFRNLKVLYIPSFLQYVLSLIGIFINRARGLKFIPILENPSKMSYKEALAVSEKVGSLQDDLQIVQDAMPRDIYGNKDVMSTAIIAGYVRAYHEVDHPVATYVTAFLNMSLRKELDLAVLYRVQYDDVEFITSALLTSKELFK